MKSCIVVNATALDASGALGILRQFVENIPSESGYRWLIFISDKVEVENKNANVKLEPISNVKSLPRRFWWDTVGLKRWLKLREIKPLAAISLQNTGFSVGADVLSYIYYHQPVPLMDFSWNIFKREHRGLWFYKNIYPLFVRLFLRSRTEVFVQLEYIKDLFNKKFGTSLDKIHIISPSVHIPKESTIRSITLPQETVNLFYPSTAVFYKNHAVLAKAMAGVADNVRLNLTITKDDCPGEIEENKYEFLGRMPYADVLSFYKACDALVFPSYIETYGLPLIEAASLGVPIIAADLPYAREVLDGYEGVTFVPYDDAEGWSRAISELRKGVRYSPLQLKSRPSWQELFNIVESKINK